MPCCRGMAWSGDRHHIFAVFRERRSSIGLWEMAAHPRSAPPESDPPRPDHPARGRSRKVSEWRLNLRQPTLKPSTTELLLRVGGRRPYHHLWVPAARADASQVRCSAVGAETWGYFAPWRDGPLSPWSCPCWRYVWFAGLPGRRGGTSACPSVRAGAGNTRGGDIPCPLAPPSVLTARFSVVSVES